MELGKKTSANRRKTSIKHGVFQMYKKGPAVQQNGKEVATIKSHFSNPEKSSSENSAFPPSMALSCVLFLFRVRAISACSS